MPSWDKKAYEAAAAVIIAMQAVELLVSWTVGRGSREKGGPHSHSGMSTEEDSSDDWDNGDPLLEDITSACLAWFSKTKLWWHAEGE